MALVFDIETNGLLKTLTRVHCLVIFDTNTEQLWRFRHNDEENTIEDGLRLLVDSDELVAGHNIIAFDIPAIQKIYPWFYIDGDRIRDTLVLVKIASPDIKNSDMQAWKRGAFPSKMIGSHSLAAWGYRLGKHKGDYAKIMEEQGLDPWATWNPEMEDYCVLDVEVNTNLWDQVSAKDIHPDCVYLEHDIHKVCAEMERNGFPFDKAAALRLKSELETKRDALHAEIVAEIGSRLRPEKRKLIKPLFYDPAGIQAKKEREGFFARPDFVNGEDSTRAWWGEVTTPKRENTRKGIKYSPDSPYVKCHFVDFNPGSRQQITDFLLENFNWKPTEFSDGGAPSVDGPTLEKLGETIPVCKKFAELFFYNKILGQLADGHQSWITACTDEGFIHGRIDTGGAVTGRCTHSKPNLGQVSAVVAAKTIKDGKPNKIFLDANGQYFPYCYDFKGDLKKESPLKGREGDYGWECRSLFRVPPKWKQVGVDLSGIEFRALAHLTAEFDGGELVEVVLNGDIHAYNQSKTGIPKRETVKRVLYGLLYGAGDEKLGITADPLLNKRAATSLGRDLRAQLMEGLPALDKAIQKVSRDASRGFITGLDGRVMSVRHAHAALNTRLQSDAAIIAKRWVCLTRQNAERTGAVCGWTDGDYLGDYVLMAFVHDELQMASAPAFMEELAAICIEAAAQAGRDFNYRCPIGAEAKFGSSWAECH